MMGHSEKRDVSVIGHITAPVGDIAHAKSLAEPHGVIVMSCQSGDGWYTLVFPPGSTQEMIDEKRDMYEIRLPDGYVFRYIPPLFQGHEKHYLRVPEVLFEYKKHRIAR